MPELKPARQRQCIGEKPERYRCSGFFVAGPPQQRDNRCRI